MQIVRTVIWVLLLVALLLFSVANWDPTVTVRIWDGIVVDTKIPAIVIVSFAIGFFPMWLYHRASKWGLKRKIANLEGALRTTAATPVATQPVEDDQPADTHPRSFAEPDADPALRPDTGTDETDPTQIPSSDRSSLP